MVHGKMYRWVSLFHYMSHSCSKEKQRAQSRRFRHYSNDYEKCGALKSRVNTRLPDINFHLSRLRRTFRPALYVSRLSHVRVCYFLSKSPRSVCIVPLTLTMSRVSILKIQSSNNWMFLKIKFLIVENQISYSKWSNFVLGFTFSLRRVTIIAHYFLRRTCCVDILLF